MAARGKPPDDRAARIINAVLAGMKAPAPQIESAFDPGAARRGAVKLALADQIRMAGLPEPEPEYRFAPPRRWRFDWAWPAPYMVAAEREGGTWKGGRHTRGSGFRKDVDKYNAAAILGWLLIRFTADMEPDGKALDAITRALAARGWKA
jgi:hypothetical protein